MYSGLSFTGFDFCFVDSRMMEDRGRWEGGGFEGLSLRGSGSGAGFFSVFEYFWKADCGDGFGFVDKMMFYLFLFDSSTIISFTPFSGFRLDLNSL